MAVFTLFVVFSFSMHIQTHAGTSLFFAFFFLSRSQMEMVITGTCSQKVRLKSKVECRPGTLKLSGPGVDIYNNTHCPEYNCICRHNTY